MGTPSTGGSRPLVAEQCHGESEGAIAADDDEPRGGGPHLRRSPQPSPPDPRCGDNDMSPAPVSIASTRLGSTRSPPRDRLTATVQVTPACPPPTPRSIASSRAVAPPPSPARRRGSGGPDRGSACTPVRNHQVTPRCPRGSPPGRFLEAPRWASTANPGSGRRVLGSRWRRSAAVSLLPQRQNCVEPAAGLVGRPYAALGHPSRGSNTNAEASAAVSASESPVKPLCAPA